MLRWTDDLRPGSHVLHPYACPEERARSAMDVFSWMPKGAKMLHLTCDGHGLGQPDLPAGLGERLRAAQREGSLASAPAESVYMAGGRLDVPWLLRHVVREAEDAKAQGYSSLVCVGDASWLSRRPELFPEFMRYEASINLLEMPLTALYLCQYDRRLFTPEELWRARMMHDQVLTGRRLERNCWIMPRRHTVNGWAERD